MTGTVTEAGTVTAELLLDRLTTSPPAGATEFSVTVQAFVPDPVMDALLQLSALSAAEAVPVPLRLIAVAALVDELLLMVNCPVAVPAAVGSNCTVSVTAWPEFNVNGKVAPDTAKLAPVSVAELTVTGAVPADVRVTDCGAAAVFTTTLPNAKLVALMLSVGIAAFNCKVKLWEMPLALADRVTA